jgi:hypothetical protein
MRERQNRARQSQPRWLCRSVFLACPAALACLATYWHGFRIEKNLAEALTTAFSLMFTLIFAIEAIAFNKKDGGNAAEKEEAKEMAVSAMSSCFLCLIANILSIAAIFMSASWINEAITATILALSLNTAMLLLLLMKRALKAHMKGKAHE